MVKASVSGYVIAEDSGFDSQVGRRAFLLAWMKILVSKLGFREEVRERTLFLATFSGPGLGGSMCKVLWGGITDKAALLVFQLTVDGKHVPRSVSQTLCPGTFLAVFLR